MSPLWVPPVLVPTPYFAPTGAAFETVPRNTQINTVNTVTSGTLLMVAIALPAGLSVGRICFASASVAAVTPTNWWFSLHDSSRVQLATTANQTTTAWAATTAKSLVVANTAAGSASSFTTTYTGLYYLGLLMTAATTVNLPSPSVNDGAGTQVPRIYGSSTTGLTTPPAFPTTAATITAAGSGPVYAWVGV